jgi:endonuclease/exonuclease/phosphatase family metal-dependent hydrolase
VFDTPAPTRTLRVLLGGMVFVLGAQSVRFFFGSLTWYVRDTLGFGVTDLIPLALVPFAAGILLPGLSRWLTVRGALWIGSLILVGARFVNQVSSDPAVEMWSSGLAIVGFVGLLPLLLSVGRSALVGGLFLGLAVDSAIKGMGLSLDLGYQDGAGAVAIVAVLGLALLFLLFLSPRVDRRGPSWGSAWTLIGIGPLLFFEFLILQNQGWTSEVAGISGPQAQLRIALLNVVTLVVLAWVERSRLAALAALTVLVATFVVADGNALVFNIMSLLAVPAAALVWSAQVPDPEERGVAPSTVYLGLGMVLFVATGLLYYVPLDLDLGFTQEQARLAAAGLVAIFGLGGLAVTSPLRPGVSNQSWAFAALVSVLPLLGFFLVEEDAPDTPAASDVVRVMTYNIHSAYNTAGRFDIEEIARVVEDSGAEIVGLQEIPRGRLISGVTDELALLKARLGFEHAVFFGTTDPTWGNAILSRHPIVTTDREPLPLVGTPMQRGYLGSLVQAGDRTMLVISTHLQHINDRSVHDEDPEADLYPVHREQIQTILQAWGGAEPAVLVGDFNARPGWSQIEDLLSAGWVDSWTTGGSGDGLTSPSADPRYRIDYVFHTPDLEVVDAGVIQSEASDHLPVVVDVRIP